MFDHAIARPSTARRNSRPGSAHFRRRVPVGLREDAALLRTNFPLEPATPGIQNSVLDDSSSGCQMLLTVTACGPSRGISNSCSTLVFRFMLREAEQASSLAGLILGRPGSLFAGSVHSAQLASSAVACPALGRASHPTAVKSARQVSKRLCQEFKTAGLTAPDRAGELSLPQLALFQDVLSRCSEEWTVRLRFCESLEDEKRAWQKEKEDGVPGELHTVYIRELELSAGKGMLPAKGSDAADDVPGRAPEETLPVAEPSELIDRLSKMEADLHSCRCEAQGFLNALETLRPLLQEMKRAMAHEERHLRSREHTLKQQFVALVKAAVERERALAELYADSQCWTSTPLADIIRQKGAVGHAAANNAAAAQLVDMLGQEGFSILDVPDMAASNEAKQQSTRNCQNLLAKAAGILRRALPKNVMPSPESIAPSNTETPTADLPEAATHHTELLQCTSTALGQERPAGLLERPGSVLAGSVAGMASNHRQETLTLPRVVEREQPAATQDNLGRVAMLLKRVLGGAEVEAWVSTSKKVTAIRQNLVSMVARCQEVPQTLCPDVPQIAAVIANCQHLAAEMAAPAPLQKCVFHTIYSDSEEEEDIQIPSDIASIPTELGSSPESQPISPSGCRDGLEVDAQPQLHENRRNGGCTARSAARGPSKGTAHSGISSIMQIGAFHNSAQRQRTPNTNSRNTTGRASTPRTPRMRSPLSGLP